MKYNQQTWATSRWSYAKKARPYPFSYIEMLRRDAFNGNILLEENNLT